MLEIIALLLTAFLFGGMVLFSFAFAAFLFTHLPPADAGKLVRSAFPYFYLWCIVLAGLSAAAVAALDTLGALLLAGVAITTVPARQLLMPAINAAQDSSDKRRFNLLHSASVVITLAQIAVVAWVLSRFL